jgi:hypothetical protein
VATCTSIARQPKEFKSNHHHLTMHAAVIKVNKPNKPRRGSTHHPLEIRVRCIRDEPRQSFGVPHDVSRTSSIGEPVSEAHVCKQLVPAGRGTMTNVGRNRSEATSDEKFGWCEMMRCDAAVAQDWQGVTGEYFLCADTSKWSVDQARERGGASAAGSFFQNSSQKML